MPNVADVVDIWMPICSSELAAAHAANYPPRASEYGPYLREFLASGLRVTPQQLSAARKRQAELITQFAALLNSVDAMAGPACRRSACRAGSRPRECPTACSSRASG
jgi:Asp-tRNA(Asn)/Glu-tRNA(Gln) amidotransferase A subunit family amidase